MRASSAQLAGGDDEVGAQFRQRVGKRFTDARTGSGDPNRLAVKVTFQCLNFNLELLQRISVE